MLTAFHWLWPVLYITTIKLSNLISIFSVDFWSHGYNLNLSLSWLSARQDPNPRNSLHMAITPLFLCAFCRYNRRTRCLTSWLPCGRNAWRKTWRPFLCWAVCTGLCPALLSCLWPCSLATAPVWGSWYAQRTLGIEVFVTLWLSLQKNWALFS